MKVLLVVLAVVAAADISGALTPGIRIKFGVGLIPGSNFFYSVPLNIPDAQGEGWTITERPEGPYPELVMYCPEDKGICLLYDEPSTLVAGLQVAISQDNFTNNALDWSARGFVEWSTNVGGNPTKLWAIQQYYVSDVSLSLSAEERIAAFDSDVILQEDAVWVTGINRELVRIPTTVEDIVNTPFTEQGCVVWMGRHYYYNMTKSSQCNAEDMFPWFLLVSSGKLVGVSLMTFGQLPVVSGRNDWFERPGRSVVEFIVPEGPECLYDLVDSNGVLTSHVYLVNRPYQIFTC